MEKVNSNMKPQYAMRTMETISVVLVSVSIKPNTNCSYDICKILHLPISVSGY
jgi:hypothetical protein